MPILEWNDAFLPGIEEFDEHHKHLFGLLNNVYDEFIAKASRDRIEFIIHELIDYATYHFAAEEFWMKKNHYPKIDAHKREHDSFTETVLSFEKDFIAGKALLNMELLSFLSEWIANHMLKTDAEYGRFMLSQKGVSITLD